MESSFPNNQAKYLTLIQAAQKLSVSVDVLLQWNDFNILKPTITQRGQIVYSQEQIDKFLEAQQLLYKKVEAESTTVSSIHEEGMPNQNYTQINLPSSSEDTRNAFITSISSLIGNRLFPVGSAVTLAILLVTFISLTHLGSGKSPAIAQNTQAPAQKPDESSNVSTAQPDTSAFSQSAPLSIKSSPSTNNLDFKLANNKFSQTTITGSKLDKNTQIESPRFNIGYSEIAKFSGNTDNSNNLFDDSGNIKGTTPNSDVLGVATGIGKMVHVDSPPLPTPSYQYIFMLILVIAASTVVLLRRLPAYSMQSKDGLMYHHPSDTNSHTVFEVDQKTDGTVVLYYQGNEHKLSKPELDSESDQFIERLMEISNSDLQEIDYDKSSDTNIRLSTPLSKLVTRLGFVGIKRDLFFPRTSKNKVLFRRYITDQDLIAMNLNAAELSKAFTSNSSN